jgi:hypothetical protein
MRPVRPDTLIMSGKIPDILTPLVMGMLFVPKQQEDVFPDEIDDPVMDYIKKQREDVKEAQEFIRSIDVVCEAALIDPSIIAYLSLAERIWVFKMAFLPAAVLSRFRYKPARDVEAMDDEQEQQQQAERDDAGDGIAVPVESADLVPA